jgi:3-hydroxyisobutyrate dehydrogenase-like beta-hydroxyacid dehydrogenase
MTSGPVPSPPARAAPVIAVLGLGEAGGAIATDLAAAGAQVRGFDPAVSPPPGVEPAASDADACHGADLVLSLTTAGEAEDALRQALGGLTGRRGPASIPVYADANTASADLKQRLAAAAETAGVPFADIAIMAPVPGRGLRTPMLASGPAAAAASGMLGGCGATVAVLDGPAGAAATRKLLRSVFYKGLAAAVIEALLAARAAGCEDWLREHIAHELAAADASTLDRMEQGSYRHALRRAHEMAAASELLDELAVPPRVARASQLWLEELAGQMRLTDGTVRIRDD